MDRSNITDKGLIELLELKDKLVTLCNVEYTPRKLTKEQQEFLDECVEIFNKYGKKKK